MKRSKKIFIAVGALFIIGVCAVTYDIFTRTSLPGSKKYLEESILPSDKETEVDTLDIGVTETDLGDSIQN